LPRDCDGIGGNVTALPQPDLAAGYYTPTTDFVRNAYRNARVDKVYWPVGNAEFDRWLTSALAAARKEALDEALAVVNDQPNGYVASATRRNIAAAIRALTSPTEKSE
jgi:hypothetical protein